MNESEVNKSIAHDDDVVQQDDNLVFDPYNPNNVEITLNDVQSILNNYGITAKIHNIDLYKRAFIHKSYTKRPNIENLEANIKIVERPVDCLPLKTKSNERLEFLGDGVLELITNIVYIEGFQKRMKEFKRRKK